MGGGFRIGNSCTPVLGGFMLMYGKTNTVLQNKIKIKKIKIIKIIGDVKNK